ncbi:MAG: nitrate ABC transporter permease [Anaerolineaceae bacterium]|nr:nitrate ABC transporter permease [Anaerolineaceae bacterium]
MAEAATMQSKSDAIWAGWRRNIPQALPAILTAVVVLLLWEVAVRVFDIRAFILPKPSDILIEFLNELRLFVTPGSQSILFEAAKTTFWSAFGGFVIGCGAGILVALATARWTVLSEATMPFAIAANSVPIIAFAPIMNNWFGILNPASKMAIVAIIVFFPTMINTVRGLTLVDKRQLDLMTSYAAGGFKILRALRIPNALPFIFSALRVASSLSVIGAVVAEFFGAPRTTLGVYITQQAASVNFTKAWAAILISSIIGIAFYNVVLLAERWVMPWQTKRRQAN